jgi:hypothetical protein
MHNVHRGGHFENATRMTIYSPFGSDHSLKIISPLAKGTNRVAVKSLSTRKRRASIAQFEIMSERPDRTSTKHHYAREHHSIIIVAHMFQ